MDKAEANNLIVKFMVKTYADIFWLVLYIVVEQCTVGVYV